MLSTYVASSVPIVFVELIFNELTQLYSMASQMKHKVVKNFYEALQSKGNIGHFNNFLTRFSFRRIENRISCCANLEFLSNTKLEPEFFLKTQQELLENQTVKNVTLLENASVEVELDIKHFIKDIINSEPTKLNLQSSPKKIIMEFSSPNIAKPFHIGHLRSTIIGNTLANIKKKMGNDVIKLNYLGDWGTQFGMIQLGMNLENYSEEDLKKNPLEVLFRAYVKGNGEAEKNQKLFEEAKKIFFELENGNEEITQLWNKYRNWTLEELYSAYKRLGVTFDEYSWESDYKRSKAENILKMLQEKGILSSDKKDRKVALIGDKEIPLLKSDDTTLYILRDLMAILDRRMKHKFDEMNYVVENGQSNHFIALMELCSSLGFDKGVAIQHVKFGRVHGMSTRKGNVVFLFDVLDEARDRVYEKQINSKTTKVTLENKDVADILGVSAVIVNDLKQRRLRDYEFDWNKCLQLKGETGPSLQYCHSRLCNLEIESGGTPAVDCDPEALLDPAAVDLVLAIAKYEEYLCLANEKLEPCTLVRFLFNLKQAVGIAYKNLNVKHSETHLASQRLLLFKRSREVLNEGLRLLGLQPLENM